jgi:hypothetical protein
MLHSAKLNPGVTASAYQEDGSPLKPNSSVKAHVIPSIHDNLTLADRENFTSAYAK